MRLLLRSASIGVLLTASAFAQPFSVGVTGGIGITDAFSNLTYTFPNVQSHFSSPVKDYVVGPTVELRLPFSLGVEFDALYRPLNLTIREAVGVASPYTVTGTVNTWEFPLLAKYRFRRRIVRPFVEAGPSFRHQGTEQAPTPSLLPLRQLSDHGFSLGGGIEASIEARVFRLRVAPQIRYTRWAPDASTTAIAATSNVNQAELLLGISF